MLVFAWIVFSGLIWPLAERRGRDGYLWFFFALVTSPLLAGMMLFALQDLAQADAADKAATAKRIEGKIVSHEHFADQIGKSKALVDRKIVTPEEHQKLLADLTDDVATFGIKGTEMDFLTALAGLVESGAISTADLSSVKAALEKRRKPFAGESAA